MKLIRIIQILDYQNEIPFTTKYPCGLHVFDNITNTALEFDQSQKCREWQTKMTCHSLFAYINW